MSTQPSKEWRAPSTVIKDHKVIFGEKEGRAPLPISEQKAETLRRFLKDRNAQYIDLTDDDGNYSETIKKTSIKGIEKLYPDASSSDGRWVCDWGNRHPMSHGATSDPDTGEQKWTALNCGCLEYFGCTADEMMVWLQANYNCQIPFDARKHMHDTFLRNKSLGANDYRPVQTGKDAAAGS